MSVLDFPLELPTIHIPWFHDQNKVWTKYPLKVHNNKYSPGGATILFY